MNINESHYSAIPWDEEGEGSRGVSGGPAQGGDESAFVDKCDARGCETTLLTVE
jgi:hypothetical protein